MESSGDDDQPNGRHRGRHRLARDSAGRRWARGARGGFLFATALALSTVLSRLIFHRDFPGTPAGFGAFVTDTVSIVLALVCLAVIASLAAPLWNRARRRPGGPWTGGQPGSLR